jgi:alcohol dehydrogenase
MDLAKGIAILLTNPGRGIDYRGMDLVQKPGVPVILFPTTAGTGSEVTKTASFVDFKEKKKLGINGRYIAAWAGVLDPVLTLSCPAVPTISAGLDALVHCVESFTALTSSLLAREIAKTAFPYIFNNLWSVLKKPQNIGAREKVLLGSHLAGMAMWNAAGGGPASGISYPVGVVHGVPHGFAGGILLPYVIRYNIEQGYRGYEPLYNLIDGGDSEPPQGRSPAFAHAVAALYERLGVPKDFTRWGVRADAVSALVEDTLTNRKANLTHNPVPFGRAQVEALVRTVVTEDTTRAKPYFKDSRKS